MKRILIIDGQGGGMGAQLAKLLLPKLPADCELLAVGTNVLATSAMLKAGAVCGATGEMRWCTMPPEPMLSWDPSVS